MWKNGESSKTAGARVYENQTTGQYSNPSLASTDDESNKDSTELQFLPLSPPPNSQSFKARDAPDIESKGKMPMRLLTEPLTNIDLESQPENNCNITSTGKYGSTDEISSSSSWVPRLKSPVARNADRLFTWKVNCYIIPVAGFSSLAQLACLPFLLVYTIPEEPDVVKAFNAAVAGSVLGSLVLLVLSFKRALFWWKKVDKEEGATKSRWELLMVANSLLGFAWLWCLYYLLGLKAKSGIGSESGGIDFGSESILKF
ncbi:hypothetical protein TWF506_004715 [Arthrobotrys conoides]|uniref:Uncharacterized protein n=1 Tax=Arthrobotrys conoides TaxID=74498 RepID=A0AAN8RI31_9PEZI